ncbi:hypothetical protein HWB05_gp070 [Streptomyces phage BRock]|uniref:Uncharacterized protein n=1 Tax=Streptomyces phage BRock TaxID=1913591 RepID=A0A1J0GVX8_9CAUD|nr:hypothetical protein HWB05_gp070 [Streptomyces phage BRock]APC46332.1 hypothetical protein [Streptomyces phage BRock]
MLPDDIHIGRSWDGHTLEDGCPCPKEACGLVRKDRIVDECPQHHFSAAKSLRQSHTDSECPKFPTAYRGVPLPPIMKEKWDTPYATCWRKGIDAAFKAVYGDIQELMSWDYVEGSIHDGMRMVREDIRRWHH